MVVDIRGLTPINDWMVELLNELVGWLDVLVGLFNQMVVDSWLVG